jgi:hypothetical protein
MAFTCPRCGNRTFRILKDGSGERECLGATVHEKPLRVVKSEFSPEALLREPRSSRTRTRSRAADAVATLDSTASPSSLTVTVRAKLRCMFVWPASDDHLYGVEEGSAGPESATTRHETQEGSAGP